MVTTVVAEEKVLIDEEVIYIPNLWRISIGPGAEVPVWKREFRFRWDPASERYEMAYLSEGVADITLTYEEALWAIEHASLAVKDEPAT